MFFTFSQPQHVLNLFLIYWRFSASCSYKKGSYKKKYSVETFPFRLAYYLVTIHACTVDSCLHRCHRNLHSDWLISFEIVIARNYNFLHGITLFCTELQSNCTAFDQQESSNFLMYMIKYLIVNSNCNEI